MPKRPEYTRDAPLAQRFRERLAAEQERQGMSDAGLARRVTGLGFRMTAATVWKIKSAEPPRKVDLDEAHALAAALGYDSVQALVGDDASKRCRDIAAAVDRDMQSIRAILRGTGRDMDEFAVLRRSLTPVDRVRLSAEIADSLAQARRLNERFFGNRRGRRGWLLEDDVQLAVGRIEQERAEAAGRAAEEEERRMDAHEQEWGWMDDLGDYL